MATLRIQFPERDKPSVVELRGRRITVGRTPNNTIQILDRTLSGRHAELFEEDGHYRVHDAGSSNGVFVNGNLISDFHLHEACKLTFGSVECDYDPAGHAVDAEEEALPTQADLATLREQNAELTQKLTILQDELNSLSLLQPANAGEVGMVVPQAEHERVAIELAATKEEQLRLQHTIARLTEDLAVTLRDNENLERALSVLKAALDKASPFNASASAAPAGSATFTPTPKPSTASLAPAVAPAATAPKPAFASPSPTSTATAPKPAAPLAGAPKPSIPLAPKPGVQAPPPGMIKPSPSSPAAATNGAAKPAGAPTRPPMAAPMARPPGSPVAAPAGARPSIPSAGPASPKAGPPGMISSSAPKAGIPKPMARPPGAAPVATGPKPVLKPMVSQAGPPGMVSKGPEDGAKTQKIEA